MPEGPAYQRYAKDTDHMREYAAYQDRYASTIRESDRVLIDHIARLVGEHDPRDRVRVLDVGCSTGNLLRHLKACGLPLDLAGADLSGEVLEVARGDESLHGIPFQEIDIVADAPEEEFDVITFNAVFFAFGHEEFRAAVANARRSLRPGGAVVCFDLFHPFEQEIDITETSAAHPGGLRIVMRGYRWVREAFLDAGLSDPEFHPFNIPIDLPGGDDPASIQSYTVADQAGRRLCFRGSLFQPWCHAIGRRA